MKLGSRSLLFGVHQFIWHPFTVWLAWVWLYDEFPGFRETVCIFIHDWGYWGVKEMDGPDGERHPERGAGIAGFLFGPKYRDLVLYHSRTFAKLAGRTPSKLCWPDKVCLAFDPFHFYVLRASLTGEIAEYRKRAAGRGFMAAERPHIDWYEKLKARSIEDALKELANA